MFAGTLTRNPETAAAAFSGTIHSTRFDIAIGLETRTKMSDRSPDYDVTAVNKAGRKVRIGTAWNETWPGARNSATVATAWSKSAAAPVTIMAHLIKRRRRL